MTNSGVSNSAATSFLNSQTYNSNKPKAFINWVCLDEQFKYYSSSSGFEQVGNSNSYTTHTRTDLTINKNGYLYIYVSNETPNIDVFFDNLQVTHIRGTLLEETHYYPFGLTMNAISTKPLSFGSPENKNKFNSAELNNDFQLNQYEFFFRNYEPQIGRFWQLDPKPVDSISLYAFGLNNPIKYFDLLGDTVGIDLLRNEVEPELNNPNKRGANGVNDGVFAVFAHANDRFVQLRESDGKPYGMYNKEALNNVLSTLSPEWKKAMEEKKEITLIIYGCNSGSKEYWDVHNNVLVCNQNPIAQQMSEYSNLTVVAPNGYFVYGQFQDGYTKPMAVMQTSLSQHDNTGQGALITFKGGKAIAEMKFAFNGTGKPDKGKKKLLK